MSTFEYLAKDIQVGGIPAERIGVQLNEFGKEGWELISTLHRENQFWCFLFKREKR